MFRSDTTSIPASRRHMLMYLFVVGLLLITTACNTTDSDSEVGELFDSERIAPGESFSFTFQETGTVDYHCSIHAPDMKGKVQVESGAADSGQVTVEMENTEFVPQTITIAPQTTVKWVNRDDFEHTVVSGAPEEDDGDGGGGYGGY